MACSAPSHHLNQCWLLVNWTLSNKLQWNLNRNTKFFIRENAIEDVRCKMATILSREDELMIWHENALLDGIASKLNPLAPGRCNCDFKLVNMTLILRIYILYTWKCPQANPTRPRWWLVKHCFRRWLGATSYPNHCWPSSMTPHGITKPQWVNCKQIPDSHITVQPALFYK